jgi:hypothetical protein
LDDAIKATDEALAMVPHNHHNHSVWASNQSNNFSDLFKRTGWLWNAVTRPSLNALSFKRPIQDIHVDGKIQMDWPHMWWIPAAVLSQLPFHATGRHYVDQSESVDGDAVLHRVMSSYTSSIRALICGRRLHARATTPGHANSNTY